MEAGIVDSYSNASGAGTIRSTSGSVLWFKYEDGQNMMSEPASMVPAFTGRHEQAEGHRLKVPRIGDAVLFSQQRHGLVWGYVRHFVDLAEHRFGTDFAAPQ